MTKLLEEAVRDARALPEDQQDRAAEVLAAYMNLLNDETWDADRG